MFFTLLQLHLCLPLHSNTTVLRLRNDILNIILKLHHLNKILLQMKFFLLTSCVVLMSVLVAECDPVAKPDPGHMVLQYYKDQYAQTQVLSRDKLQLRCESQVYSGFVSDRRCQEWIDQHYNSSSINKLSCWSVICVVVAMIRSYLN
jgi:hypothetical protein